MLYIGVRKKHEACRCYAAGFKAGAIGQIIPD